MESPSDIQQTGSGKFSVAVRIFFFRWSALLVMLYGMLGFLFYLFLLLSNHGMATISLPFRELSKGVLWFWLLVFAVMHFAVFSGGLLLLLYNKVSGFILVIIALSFILLANAIINEEINYTSWAILLILGFFLSRWRNPRHQ
jgi:hypothetical protein